MFLHCFKYTFLDFIRNKTTLFWVVLFPMILGTFFNFAFMSIYDNEFVFNEIPVAVVNGCEEGGVKALIEGLGEGGTEFVKAQYVDEETALELLKSSEVDGIIYDDLIEPELTVRSGGGMSASILKVFLDRYKTNAQIIMNVAQKDPEKLPEVIEAMGTETAECLKLEEFSSGNRNCFTTYFYNLLAMSCLFVSMIGMWVSINSQANLSAVGARGSVAPASKMVKTAAGLAAATIIFYTGTLVATAYLFFVLKIDFGISFIDAAVIDLFGVAFGLSLGFFVGSIGRMSFGTKDAILIAVTLGTSLLSGLMEESIPMLIEEKCPVINRINPSRLIGDSFYAINSYGWGERAFRDLATLTAITIILVIGGCLITRKRKFKTL